jgi:arylsulfatase A-like enzyme
MGYGDIQALNPEGKIPTPNLDRLVHNGMTFTDAHSSSAVCTPTRYSLLTGRYNWRTRLANGVTWGYSRHLIDVDRLTVADVLQVGGYRTACIGKWHLGLDWTLQEGKTGNLEPSNYPGWDIDFTVPIRNGPNELGFDYFYGISASLDMHPYVFIENNRVVGLPTAEKAFHVPNRPGPAEPGFEAEEVLSILTKKAVEYIDSESKINYPFFLYFPLTAPHTPILPTEEWQGKSQMNPYADFVMQVDATVGAVLQSLEENNELENTLLIFSSDNGCSPQADFPELKTYGHNPSHVFRGHKADIFEGGHRVPFIVHWPETIKERSANDTLIGLTDFFATCAEFAQYPLGRGFGEDSVSLLPLFKGESKGPIHDAVVHHSINGSFAIRKGKWKLIACPDSGGWSVPRPGRYDVSKLPKVQLYDLEKDIGETHNLAVEKPERAEEMLAELNQLIQRGRSTPGEPAQNDRAVPIIGVD